MRGPLEALGRQLQDEFGAIHLFRPYRDVRFSKDKTPYKDHQGMFAERGDGIGWYVQISATGLMVAGGWYSSSRSRSSDTALQCRGGSAHELAKLTARLAEGRNENRRLGVATRPRGVSADHRTSSGFGTEPLHGAAVGTVRLDGQAERRHQDSGPMAVARSAARLVRGRRGPGRNLSRYWQPKRAVKIAPMWAKAGATGHRIT